MLSQQVEEVHIAAVMEKMRVFQVCEVFELLACVQRLRTAVDQEVTHVLGGIILLSTPTPLRRHLTTFYVLSCFIVSSPFSLSSPLVLYSHLVWQSQTHVVRKAHGGSGDMAIPNLFEECVWNW